MSKRQCSRVPKRNKKTFENHHTKWDFIVKFNAKYKFALEQDA